MRCIFPVKLIGRNRRSCKFILLFIWCAGLIGGIWTAVGAGNITSLMRACVDSRVTIVGLLFVPMFPFLISAIAVYFSFPRLIYPISFLKAFAFGFCVCAVSCAFGSAGWLIRFLLLFTDCVTLPVLCWFWLRHADGNKAHLGKDMLVCVLWFLAAGILDYKAVLPLLMNIF